ncbi:hypothetical protein BELL_0052g00060 [Botrytis elliptica]|uniref:BTB domain-containing protein n=1 Tax=Botrytis elliptica TaxID=278938 RepID=A0A4Z1JY56_9HELO|nr:hypothetical protein EAE99_008351 [Botrytis elliptica]TGO78831.1 hypothetical protein BELL_0052g00060 [Botrytis elliptica]
MDQTHRLSPKLKVFSLPDQTPDTKFVLFGETEIHLHSTVLRLHSAFFRKFLDSPDKKPAEPSAEFRYEWVSEIEEDGEWHMVEKSHAKPNDNVLSENTIWDTEVLVFIEMLNALYRIPYKIWVARLFIVTKMADYYCCLPAVSNNLFACFDQSDNEYVAENAVRLLDIAYKLRQPLLFKDCLIYVAGYMPRDSENSPHVCNRVIFDVVMIVRNEINRRVVEAQQLLMLSKPSKERSRLLGHCWEVGFEETKGKLSLPRYFRILAEHDSEFASILSNVLQCELRLPEEISHEAGARFLNDINNFYCARLLDSDLPWDLTETDW